jgi:hypothetical protein
MDMMRPQTVYVARELADAPVLTWTPGSVILDWTDGTPVTIDPLTWGSPKAEIGYRIERAINGGAWEVIGTALANVITFTDPIVIDPATMYEYRVAAYNAAGDSFSNVVTILPTPPTAPATLVATAISWTQVDLSWADMSANETGFRLERAPASGGVVTGPFAPIQTLGANATSFSDMTTAPSPSMPTRCLPSTSAVTRWPPMWPSSPRPMPRQPPQRVCLQCCLRRCLRSIWPGRTMPTTRPASSSTGPRWSAAFLDRPYRLDRWVRMSPPSVTPA